MYCLQPSLDEIHTDSSKYKNVCEGNKSATRRTLPWKMLQDKEETPTVSGYIDKEADHSKNVSAKKKSATSIISQTVLCSPPREPPPSARFQMCESRYR